MILDVDHDDDDDEEVTDGRGAHDHNCHDEMKSGDQGYH